MMFGVCKVVKLLKDYFLSLVLSYFVVGFEKLILDSYFLYVKVWIDINVFYLQFKWKASLNQISGIEYFYLTRLLLHPDQVTCLQDQGCNYNLHFT